MGDRAGWIKGNHLPDITKLQIVQTSIFSFQNIFTFLHFIQFIFSSMTSSSQQTT